MTSQQLTKAIDTYARKHSVEARTVRACKVLLEAAKREWKEGGR